MTEWPARTCSVAGHSHSCWHSSGNVREGGCFAVEIPFFRPAGALPRPQPVNLRGLKNWLRGIDQTPPGLTMEVGPQARSAGVSQAAMRACGTHGGMECRPGRRGRRVGDWYAQSRFAWPVPPAESPGRSRSSRPSCVSRCGGKVPVVGIPARRPVLQVTARPVGALERGLFLKGEVLHVRPHFVGHRFQ